MNITLEQVQGSVPVAVLGIHGEMDGSNYEQLIRKCRQVYENGGRHLLLDMRGMPLMSSAGLVALHSIILMFAGKQPPDPKHGWAALRAIDRELPGEQQFVKLLGPQSAVERVLEKTGMLEYFEVHTDREAALFSF